MADKHPYMSGSGGVTQLVSQLRKSFPTTAVTADTLKKLGIAPQNETYVLNILKFIGILDSENKKTTAATPAFSKHDNAEFQQEFAKLVREPYHALFDLYGEDAWTLPNDRLISFFRNHDDTSDVVGKRQATTFQSLARISGKLAAGTTVTIKSASKIGYAKTEKKGVIKAKKSIQASNQPEDAASSAEPAQSSFYPKAGGAAGVGLTVRIEINLPPGGDQSTYDAIFKSIRENLLNGNDT
jgi:hypothetical protein